MYSKVDLFRKVQFALINTPFSSLEVKLDYHVLPALTSDIFPLQEVSPK